MSTAVTTLSPKQRARVIEVEARSRKRAEKLAWRCLVRRQPGEEEEEEEEDYASPPSTMILERSLRVSDVKRMVLERVGQDVVPSKARIFLDDLLLSEDKSFSEYVLQSADRRKRWPKGYLGCLWLVPNYVSPSGDRLKSNRQT